MLEMAARIAGDMVPMTGYWMLKRLRAAGVKMETKCEAVEINEHGVLVNAGGRHRTVEADTVVLATATILNDWLEKQLKGLLPDLQVKGDCGDGAISEMQSGVGSTSG